MQILEKNMLLYLFYTYYRTIVRKKMIFATNFTKNKLNNFS